MVFQTYNNNYYVAVPPEQVQILKKIKTGTNKIDQAISKPEKEIALLQEYQKSMIAEAVLGKVSI
ncbi:MAG: hypothetical protein L3J23_04605 [Flavobacteriaceae bacterium]|nr:hypothetical protein [Flavobacteriaceae bacterium]